MTRLRGFSLVELLVFIVIFGIAAYALLRSFASVLPRSPTPAQLTQATLLAQERMELILGQRDALGYNAANLDPCGAGPACTNALGYTVASAGTAVGTPVPWPANPATANYKLVTVTVSLGGIPLATQSAVLSNYLP
jgi:prepilin-type N-terminal cleavage/methylation domain-containing protein